MQTPKHPSDNGTGANKKINLKFKIKKSHSSCKISITDLQMHMIYFILGLST
jgi:hypothetical protein